MKSSKKLIAIAAVLFLVGCDHMTHTEQNMLGGTALGAVVGTAVGAIASSHGAGAGALIGAGVGLLGGFAYDRLKYDDVEF